MGETGTKTGGFARPGTYLELMRPFTLLAPAIGFLSGAAIAASGLPPLAALVGALGAALLNSASNVANQCFEIEVDRINKPGRALPSGRVSLRQAAVFGGVLYGCALLLAYLAHPPLLAIFAPAALLTYLYSAPPVRLRRHALTSSLALGIGRGCLVMVAGWMVVQPVWHATPWFVGLVFGLYIFGAGNTKDFADVRGDGAHGFRTLPILFGARRAALMIVPFLVGPFLLVPVGVAFGWVPARGLCLTPLAVWGAYVGWLMLRRPEALTIESNHVSWMHMYLLLIAGQLGFAGVYAL